MAHDASNALRFLPLALDVRGRNCLVVGGGGVGTRKVLTLLRAGAVVTVVSPTVSEELAEQIETGTARWVKEPFREEHLQDTFLAVAATDDAALNATVARLAVERGALACDASSAERSQVIFGALLQHDEATVAVFTGGRDPSLARDTRNRIAELLVEKHPTESPLDDRPDAQA